MGEVETRAEVRVVIKIDLGVRWNENVTAEQMYRDAAAAARQTINHALSEYSKYDAGSPLELVGDPQIILLTSRVKGVAE